MERFLVILLCALSVATSYASTDFTPYKGVYANDRAEAVFTDSVCIMYFQKDSTMQAILEIPGIGVRHKTVFTPDGTVSFPADIEPLVIRRDGDSILNVNGMELEKVEDITTVEPYEMGRCSSGNDVGKSLQEWRLGVSYGLSDNIPSCEVNTNRHMFVYMNNPAMIYIRAAATRNNNKGTLFFQNIRMMKNRNTGEYTMHMKPGNLSFAKSDLEIDNTKFQPNSCTFNPDGGIYWSLISFEPELILINGCGETYQVGRREKDSFLKEWIKYEPYSIFPTL